MQLHLTLEPERLVLPLHHQHALQSALYSLLARSSHGLQVHDAEPEFGERAFRGFVFGQLKGERKVICVGATPFLQYTGTVTLEVRTPLPDLAETFIFGAEKQGQLTLLKNPPITIAGISKESATPCGTKCAIRMETPIVARRTEGKREIFYSPQQPEFAELLRRNFTRKYTQLTGRETPYFDVRPLEIDPVSDFVRSEFKGHSFRTWLGTYQLEGEGDGLDFLYDYGLGSKNSAGFGMFRVAD